MADHSAAFYALKKKYLQKEPAKNEESVVTQRAPSARDNLSARTSLGHDTALMEQLAQSANKPRDANLYDMTIGSVQRGYLNSVHGQESFDAMQGKENEAQKYADLLASDKYNFQADGLIGKGVSGAAEQLGQQLRQWTDPETLALAGGMAGAASLAGKAGPQLALPEEVITVPGAFLGGMKLGSAKSNLEIEAGHSYNELLENGVSEDTARKIAMGVGVGNAALDLAQLDELVKSFKVLQRSGADDTVLDIIGQELKRRGLDVAKETVQEVAQEGVTIGGTQLGSYLDNGQAAYSMDEVIDRLRDTAASSALSFGIMNVPGGAYNVYHQGRWGAGQETARTEGDRETYTPEQPVDKALEQVETPVTLTQEDEEVSSILRQLAAEMEQERSGTIVTNVRMRDPLSEPTLIAEEMQRGRREAIAEAPQTAQERPFEPVGVDTTQAQRTAETARNVPLNDLLAGGKRVDVTSLSESHYAERDQRGDVWVDSKDQAYQMQPEQHISQRTVEGVGNRKVNVFQFDHPELRQYVKRAAEDLVKDASLSLNTPADMRQVRDTQGKKYVSEILDSPPLRKAMDMGLSRNEIIKAAEDLIADHGQENYAAAKRLELILDEMLTEGYTTVEGEVHEPDTAYIQAKAEIPGYQERQREELPIWDMEEGVIRAAQAAYDAGRANVPRESAALVDPVQEEAYHAGRLEHIRNMKPSETVEKQEAGGYTEGSENENQGGFDNGRKEDWSGAEGAALQNDTGTTEANRREAGETGEDGILRSVRVLSRGARPVHDWAEGGLTTPQQGSVAENESRIVADEYRLPVFVVRDEVFTKHHMSAPAFSVEGQVFLRSTLPDSGKDDIGVHEAGHAMKQLGFQPYLDLIEHLPEMMDRSTDAGILLLEGAAEHCGVDLFNAGEAEMTDVHDEINCMVMGAIHAQRSGILDVVSEAFYDFDGYIAELKGVHEQFKSRERQGVPASQAKHFGEKAGLIRDKNLKKAHLSSLDERRLDALGKVLGTEIRFAKTIGNGDVNAMYENGVITVALDADDPVMTSVLHETIHRLREVAPESYDELAGFVWDNMSERMKDLNLKFRSKLYETNDRDALTEEMVADAFGVMLGDGTVLDQFIKDKRSAVEKLRDIVRDIIKAVQRALNKQNVTLSANQKAAFRDLRQGLQEMEQRFADSLERAQGETKNTAGTGQHSKKSRVQLDEYIAKYGAIPQGESPARTIQMPKRTSDDKKLSRTVRTVMEAEATPEELLPDIEQLAAEGVFSFESYTDKQAVRDAAERIGGKNGVGWEQAQREWFSAMKEGVVSKENTTLGWTLYNHAANSKNTQLALDILNEMVKSQRSAAQALQATRILKKLSPETQLYQVQRSVNNLQEELNQRYGDKKGPTLKVDEELGQRFLEAETQEERDEVLKDIYRDIGRQMPSRFMDKWNAWRYLAMLGNPRTHVRNVLGNAGFAPVVAVKNLAATGIEAVVYRVSGGKLNRNKKLVGLSKRDRALLAAAWNDFAYVEETALDGGKYDDFANANKYIEQGRVVFGTTKSKVWNATGGKALEKARTGNTKAMEREDMWFSQPHYAYALSQYCKAHGITAEQMKDGKIPDAARQYAVKEAQKATYRDTNNLSQAISALGRYQGNNPVGKGISVLAEGLLPFRKTPANILARGLEYSPFGLMSGVKQALWDVRKGKKTGAEAIDSISAGLTGTGLLILGGWMAAQGLIRGGGSGDEEEKEFAELMGHQTYALELPDGTSVTLDWLAPECLPFFVGVNLWEQTGSEKATLSDWLEAVSGITEPLLEMSCLQSLNDAFDAVGYVSDSGVEGLPAFLADMAASYMTQGIPTLLGQMERTSQAERMTTYTSKSKWTTSDIQRTLGTASGKIPGWDYRQIPYIDAWGRTERTGAMGERAFNNFLNPAYMSKIEESPMERELLRLYEATGEGGVFPTRAERKFTVDQKEKELTAEEYVKYATTKGQTAYKLIGELTTCAGYQQMSDREKAEAVKKAYEYASQTAKAAVSDYEVESWVKNTKYIKTTCGISQGTFLSMRAMTSKVESLKETGKDGEPVSIDNSKGLQIMEMLYDKKLVTSLTQEQRETLFAYLGVGKSVRHYNQARVREKLAQMRKRAKQ